MTLAAGSTFKSGVQTLVHVIATPANVVLVTGFLDGDPTHGQITYLGGHAYPTATPISTNPPTNGARLFLDGLFASSCAGTASNGQ
jgi:hypothetical protein